jgi:RNA polymerase sigma factor for flagellar operon FliA
VEIDDLMQAGMLGLLEAATNYAADRGASFETYAGIRIRGAMIDALRKLDWAPRSVHRKARAVAAAVQEIERQTGRDARDSEIASRLGVSLEEYHTIVHDAASCRLAALDDAAVTVEGEADPFIETADEEFRAALATAIDGLPERERLVMSLYYTEGLNLKEIGAVLRVTESRACQLHGQALVRLKARLSEWRDGPHAAAIAMRGKQ